jgi:hypothetical protein
VKVETSRSPEETEAIGDAGGTVDGFGMSEATVEEVEEFENGYRDRKSLEAELQAIVRSKTDPSPSPGFWAKRRRKT